VGCFPDSYNGQLERLNAHLTKGGDGAVHDIVSFDKLCFLLTPFLLPLSESILTERHKDGTDAISTTTFTPNLALPVDQLLSARECFKIQIIGST
jgi:hypothetical protein